MPVECFVNQKGGCSKSTSSTHYSRWLHREGYTVAIIDCDAQKSSAIWIDAMRSEKFDVPVFTLTTPDDVLEKVPDIAEQHDFVVIDGPGGISELTRAILLVSDVALVPCQPSGLDIRSGSDAVRLIKQAQKVRGGAPTAALFLSRAVKGTTLKDEALAVLNELGYPVLNTVIHQRQAIADSFGQQATVFDMSGRAASDCAREYEKLFKEIQTLWPANN
jgi:chromosome partitioning protein